MIEKSTLIISASSFLSGILSKYVANSVTRTKDAMNLYNSLPNRLSPQIEDSEKNTRELIITRNSISILFGGVKKKNKFIFDKIDRLMLVSGRQFQLELENFKIVPNTFIFRNLFF